MKSIFHPANERGHADHGWLNARHSFSFSSWYDPSKVHFGVLRVLNDDIVAAGTGFGMHPHKDMEIITILLEGELQHRDDMGNGSIIRKGDVQVMSAGTGVYHAEFNPSESAATNLFQLWIFPKENNITPRYDQKSFPLNGRKNRFQTIASGIHRDEELYIHQDAVLSRCSMDTGTSLIYPIAVSGNGVYIIVISGAVSVGDQSAHNRDAVGIWDCDHVELKATEDTELLIIEVPMR